MHYRITYMISNTCILGSNVIIEHTLYDKQKWITKVKLRTNQINNRLILVRKDKL